MNTIRVSNSLDQDKDQHFVGHNVGPDQGPNCLHRLISRRQKSLLAGKKLKVHALLSCKTRFLI